MVAAIMFPTSADYRRWAEEVMASRQSHDTPMLVRRTDDRCHYCHVKMLSAREVRLGGDPQRLRTNDHVIPLSAGGSDKPRNIVKACAKCNGRKGSMPYAEFLMIVKSVLPKSNDAQLLKVV